MPYSIYAILIASLFPAIIGFIWYNPNVFGKAWMQASGVTEEQIKSSNMLVIMLISLVLSFLLAFALAYMVVHQAHVFSLMVEVEGFGKEGSEIMKFLESFMAEHGNKYRTFGHGALHGAMGGFTVALPIIGMNAIFERKSFKYIAIHVGYWMLTMALMGGLICAWQ
jgi:hypothetical protein